MTPPVFPHDLQDAVRALLAACECDRAGRARGILARAKTAARYRAEHNVAHPQFGTGSVSSAARSYVLAPVPGACDSNYMQCLRLFLETYLKFGSYHDL